MNSTIQRLHFTNQSWLATFVLVAVMLISFGVATLDNSHHAVEKVVAEASDIGEETELMNDDLMLPQVSFNIKPPLLVISQHVNCQVAAQHDLQKYVLSPRAPPLFI